MIEKFKTHESIHIHTVEENDFRDWDQLLSLLYNRIKDVSKYHIFYVNKNEPSTLYKRVDNISDLVPIAQVMLKKNAEGGDRDSDKLSNGECMGVDFEREEVVLVARLFWKEKHTKAQEKSMAKFLPVLKFPGLRDIKKIEMSNKFKPLIPPEYQDYCMYNQATDEMIEQSKDEKRAKLLRKRMANPNCNYELGTVIKKKFERKFYVGKVVDYNVKEGRYKILYDDGDKEEFDEEEMFNYVVSGGNAVTTKKPAAKKATQKKQAPKKTGPKKTVARPRGRPKKNN